MPTLQHRLVRAFVELADTLVDDFDVTDLLHTLVERLMQSFKIAAVGLLLTDEEGTLTAVTASGEEARIISLLQLQRKKGPSFEAFSTGRYVVSNDLAASRSRWPEVVDEALSYGYTAVHAVPMKVRDTVVGAINLFETAPHKLTPEDVPVIRGMAEIATIAILQARAMNEALETADQLRVALRTRVILEQAKGMISQSHGISMEKSFSLLRSYARERRLRLNEVANQIVDGRLHVSDIEGLIG